MVAGLPASQLAFGLSPWTTSTTGCQRVGTIPSWEADAVLLIRLARGHGVSNRNIVPIDIDLCGCEETFLARDGY